MGQLWLLCQNVYCIYGSKIDIFEMNKKKKKHKMLVDIGMNRLVNPNWKNHKLSFKLFIRVSWPTMHSVQLPKNTNRNETKLRRKKKYFHFMDHVCCCEITILECGVNDRPIFIKLSISSREKRRKKKNEIYGNDEIEEDATQRYYDCVIHLMIITVWKIPWPPSYKPQPSNKLHSKLMTQDIIT